MRHLFLFQLFSYALPLVSSPLLFHRLGEENFGFLAFGLASVFLLSLVSDLGLSYAAVARIANARVESLSTIIADTQASKFFAAVVLTGCAQFAIWVNPDWHEVKLELAVLSTTVLANALHPVWLFNGLRRPEFMLWPALLSRLAYVGLICVFAWGPSDLLLVCVLNVSASACAAVGGWLFALRIGVKLTPITVEGMVRGSLDGLPYLMANFAGTSLSSLTVMFLGFSGSRGTELSKAGILDQIYRSVQSLASPVSQSLFPHMIATRDKTLFRRSLLWVTLAAGVFAIAATTLGPPVLDAVIPASTEWSRLHLLLLGVAFAAHSVGMVLGFGGLAGLDGLRLSNLAALLGVLVGVSVLASLTMVAQLSLTTGLLALVLAEVCILCLRAASYRWKLSRVEPEPSVKLDSNGATGSVN